MIKNFFKRYIDKVGQEVATLHAASVALAAFVSPVLALGLLTRSGKSARITIPAAVAFACWYIYRALPLDEVTVYAVGALFVPTSPVLIALSAFIAGFILRWIIEGGLPKKAAIIAGTTALVIFTQGSGGLNEIEARDVSVVGTGTAAANKLMRVYSSVYEIQREKGIKSPEYQAASYVFFKEIAKDVGMVGVPNYRSYLIYRENKLQDSELLKTMSPMGRTDEWVKIVDKRKEDPTWPENYIEQ